MPIPIFHKYQPISTSHSHVSSNTELSRGGKQDRVYD
uniref:Uncharacterized protein n=1 Tax=Manihot esculenta TaxID=3983 RepID=A0A2C9U9R6_MANES